MPESEQIECFTAVYRAHYPQVYAYAVARAGRQLADEVAADTFLVAWRRFTAMPRSQPLPWLLGVARNVARERYRDQVRQRAVAEEMRTWVTEAAMSVTDIADGVAESAAVLAALAQLSEDDRELLTLVAWHGLTPRQAAQVVGCSTATCSVRLHRARGRLRNAMATVTEPVAPRRTSAVLVPKESIR